MLFLAIKGDSGTYTVLTLLILFVIVTITFPFIKRNPWYGIRFWKTFESEEIWHKVHVIASFWMIPIDIALFLLLFLDSPVLKSILTFVIVLIAMFISFFITNMTTKKYFGEKKRREKEELEMQKKKESGWR